MNVFRKVKILQYLKYQIIILTYLLTLGDIEVKPPASEAVNGNKKLVVVSRLVDRHY